MLERMFDVYARRRFTALLVLLVVGLLAFQFTARGDGAEPPTPYAVQSGDTLWDIAARTYSGDPRHGVEAIQSANRLASAELRPGMLLLLPATA